jgi:hypothetical protein
MQTWYDIARTARNRSTSGVSGLDSEQIGILFADFHGGEIVDREVHGEKLADILRMAAEDLRASYLEAVSAQPGQSTSPNALADWFWGETYAARVINKIRKRSLDMAAKDMRLAGELLLIPRNQIVPEDGRKSFKTAKKWPIGRNKRKINVKEKNMAKERYQIKSECPECGCGLINNMTPDEFREKYGDTKDEVPVNCSECGKEHDGCVTEQNTAA